MKLRPLAAAAAALAGAVVAVAAGSSASVPREILFVGPYGGVDQNVLAIRPDGSGLRLVAADATEPMWSPDGLRVAFEQLGPHRAAGVVVAGADGSAAHRITTGAYQPLAWSRDGRWIALTRSSALYRVELYVVHPDGSGLRRLRGGLPSAGVRGQGSWSADSRRLLIPYRDGLATITLAGRLRPVPHAACAGDAAFSPNGRWIAFSRCLDRPYHTGIAVERANGTGFRWLVRPPRAQQAGEPVWAPDGTRLAYVLFRTTQHLGHQEIRMVSLAGRNLGNLDSYAQDYDEYPDWSPDGTSIVFDRDAAVEPIGEADRLYVGDARTGRAQKLYDSIWRGMQSWRPR